MTETCDADLPHLVTQVETTIATQTDYHALPRVQAALAAHELLPAEHFVDAGYSDARLLLASQAQGIDLVGPAARSPDWQTRAGQDFDQDHFTIDWRARTATCPQGQPSVAWRVNQDRLGQPVIRIAFAHAVCLACPVRSQCTRATTAPRTLGVRPQSEFVALRAARSRQQTAEFKQRYRRRAGIEATISQAVRSFDLRQARSIGHAKTHLQPSLIAIALNLARLAAWFDGATPASTRITPFAALFLPASSPPRYFANSINFTVSVNAQSASGLGPLHFLQDWPTASLWG